MECDFLIIGSGPAGSVLSWNLANKGFKVSIVDRANNLGKTDKNSFIYSPYIKDCPDYYTPVFSNQLGGNSALWNNKVYLISEDEFNSGSWQFSYKELLKYSVKLAKEFEINHNEISKVKDINGLKYSQSKRVKKLGNIFNFLNLQSNKNITIYSNSSPVKLIFFEKKVHSAIIEILDKKQKLKIKINKSIIFCAGGLGNPHIINNLLKNDINKVGNNLCDHSHINLTEIQKDKLNDFFYFGKYFINKDKNQLEQNLFLENNKHFVGVNFDFIPDPARILKRIFIRSRKVVSKFLLSILIKYYSLFFKITVSLLSIFNIKGKYSLEFFFSQSKNENNKVKLSNGEFDKFGLNKSNISWKIDDEERKIYNNLIASLVGENGKLLNNKKSYLFDKKKIFVGLHPSCTTSIGKNKSEGCVDSNLKLFDYDNIYVSGSSVFSTNGFTNPTWTIMSLSYRLSEYLNK
tara:strand:+ start:182 stop:1567 length:1386 start_codon:yes stop_codon:yes gene_type:complete